MSHKIIAVFYEEPDTAERMLDKFCEYSPSCTVPKYDWYSLENGIDYFKPLPNEMPDMAGRYRKNQVSYTDKNAAGHIIRLYPSAYITPDGTFHQNKNDWDIWIGCDDNPFVSTADCTLFDLEERK